MAEPLQSTSLTLRMMLGSVDWCAACVIQCVTFQATEKLLVSKIKSVVCEMTKESDGALVPVKTGAGSRFIPSRQGSGAGGHGLPGLAHEVYGYLERGALRAQGNAGRPRS